MHFFWHKMGAYLISGVLALGPLTGSAQSTTLPPQPEELVTESQQPQKSLESVDMVAPPPISSPAPVVSSMPSEKIVKSSGRKKMRNARRGGAKRQRLASRSVIKKNARKAKNKARGRYVRAKPKRPVVSGNILGFYQV